MRVFVDRERPVSQKLREVIERYRYDIPSLIRALRKLIEEDPYYLETYVVLAEILENEGHLKEAEELLLEAYTKALELIRDERGRLPDRLPWKEESNRHILKAILETGIMFWELGELEKALSILKELYKMNPDDEIGVRYYITAILEGLGFEEFEMTFGKNGEYDRESLERWFEEHREKFESFLRGS